MNVSIDFILQLPNNSPLGTDLATMATRQVQAGRMLTSYLHFIFTIFTEFPSQILAASWASNRQWGDWGRLSLFRGGWATGYPKSIQTGTFQIKIAMGQTRMRFRRGEINSCPLEIRRERGFRK
jgi:hypothetical protein